jgi:hypothetical protein
VFPFGEEKADADAEVFDGEMEEKVLQAFALTAVPDFVQPLTDATVRAGSTVPPPPTPLHFSLLVRRSRSGPFPIRKCAKGVSCVAFAQLEQAASQIAMNSALVLFTKKDETPGIFKALAASYRTQMLFLVVSASDTELCAKLGVGPLRVIPLPPFPASRHCTKSRSSYGSVGVGKGKAIVISREVTEVGWRITY